MSAQDLVAVYFGFLVDFVGIIFVLIFLLMFGAAMVGMFQAIVRFVRRHRDRAPKIDAAREEIKARIREAKARQAAQAEKDDVLFEKIEEFRNGLN